eukprot:SAG22_NODE_468_length_10147_cov_77.238654_11_plen_66_part_00
MVGRVWRWRQRVVGLCRSHASVRITLVEIGARPTCALVWTVEIMEPVLSVLVTVMTDFMEIVAVR